jgi:hypothetical protein
MWNDSCHWPKWSLAQVHAEKVRAAEKDIPKDVVQVVWDYGRAHPRIVRRLHDECFEVWAAPGRSLQQVRAWKRAKPDGWLLTAWVKCERANRERIVDLVRKLGPRLA